MSTYSVIKYSPYYLDGSGKEDEIWVDKNYSWLGIIYSAGYLPVTYSEHLMLYINLHIIIKLNYEYHF